MREVELNFPDYLKNNLPNLTFQRVKVLAAVISGLRHREDERNFTVEEG